MSDTEKFVEMMTSALERLQFDGSRLEAAVWLNHAPVEIRPQMEALVVKAFAAHEGHIASPDTLRSIRAHVHEGIVGMVRIGLLRDPYGRFAALNGRAGSGSEVAGGSEATKATKTETP